MNRNCWLYRICKISKASSRYISLLRFFPEVQTSEILILVKIIPHSTDVPKTVHSIYESEWVSVYEGKYSNYDLSKTQWKLKLYSFQNFDSYFDILRRYLPWEGRKGRRGWGRWGQCNPGAHPPHLNSRTESQDHIWYRTFPLDSNCSSVVRHSGNYCYS